MTLKSSDLFTFVKLVAKLFKSSEPPTICFYPNSSTLKLCAFGKDAMLTIEVDKDGYCDPFSVRLDDLKSVACKKIGELAFDLQKNAVQVRSGEVLHRFLTGKNVPALPSRPSQTSNHSASRVFEALADAVRCVDPSNTERALQGICLRGSTSQMISTTGAQLLIQEGFDLIEEGDVICPASKIFASKELLAIDGEVVAVGLVNEHLYFAFGEVEFWLRTISTINGNYPNVERFLVPADGATTLNVDPGDRDFALSKLNTLSGTFFRARHSDKRRCLAGFRGRSVGRKP